MAGATDPIWKRALSGLKYAFTDLLRSIGLWFLLGVLIAGLITVLIPESFLEDNLGDGLFSMVLMLIVAVPLYVCATASTPVAAALALKGLSPGAALVFLLAGPATNTATIAVAAKILGKKAALVYVAAIGLCSVGAGLVVNQLYSSFGFTAMDWITGTSHEHSATFSTICAGALLAATVWAVLAPRLFSSQTGEKKGKGDGPCCSVS